VWLLHQDTELLNSLCSSSKLNPNWSPRCRWGTEQLLRWGISLA